MNALVRTITITLLFVAVNLVVVGTLPAQNAASDQETQQALAVKQAEVAQKQAEAALKQAEADQRRKAIAASAAPMPPNAPVASVAPARAVSFNGSWSLSSGGAGSVLVIPTAELKMEELVTMTEDMTVMSRIFEKNLEQARIPTARGGNLFLSSRDPFAALLGAGGGAIQSMYLQGDAALFLMKVDFPLSPPPEMKEEKQAEEKQENDPVWEQVRRDMYEPQDTRRHKTEQPEEKYDAEKVENLKTTLVKALKHAANIRSLKPDESVILTVTGSGGSDGARIVGIIAPQRRATSQRSEVVVEEKNSAGTAPAKIVAAPSSGQTTYFSPTVLVIRAKKSDIDQFAKGTLDADQFRQRAQVLTCPYLSAEGGFGDAFNSYYHLR